MESSEDDPGNATSASRRVSAREKDVGQVEDVDATSCYHQEPYDARTSCGTPVMSEDDGDSVPSPSAQDVNTSTEAILDMIDEIVDGPGAPKRIPLTLGTCVTSAQESVAVSKHSDPKQDSTKPDNVDIQQLMEVSLVGDAETENQRDVNLAEKQAECSSHIILSTEAVNTDSAVSSISCIIEPKNDKPVSVILEPNCPVSSMESELSISCSLSNIPSDNIIQDVQNNVDVSDSENLERTVKCVSSSDNRDSVTVESAESTSSDCSLSERKTVSAEPTKLSPLKRRLVRPAPSDRRPDSTVSSTADSQNIYVETTKQISSEYIVKDVSSSSDAVPPLQGSAKPEEIRNVSEISICKAETSVSPPKKIKLIRQKIIPSVCKNDVIVDKQIPTTSNQCELSRSVSPTKKLIENMPEISVCSQKLVTDSKTLNPELVVKEQTIVTLMKKEECIERMSAVAAEAVILDVPLNIDHKVIDECKKTEFAGLSLPVSTLHVLPGPEKDLINFKQTIETNSSFKNLDGTSNKINENSPKETNEAMKLNIDSNIENSKVCEEQLSKISEIYNMPEPDSEMDSKLILINEPSNSRSECCEKAEIKAPLIKLNLPQPSDTCLKHINEKHEDQASKIWEVSNISEPDHNVNSKLMTINESSHSRSECYKEEEKSIPSVILNISQLSHASQESINKEQPSKTSEVSNISEPDNYADTEVIPINEPINNISECYQVVEENIPSIKLNLSQMLDTPQEKINEKHEANSSKISEVSNILEPANKMDSKTMLINEPGSSNAECYQETEKRVPPIKLNISQLSDTSQEKIKEKHEDKSSKIPVVSNISKPDNKMDSKLITINEPSSSRSECYQEEEKRVPSIILNLSHMSDIPQKSITEEQPSKVSEVSNKSKSDNNTDLKIIPINVPSSSKSECHQEVEKKVPPIKLNLSQILDTPEERINEKHEDNSSNISDLSKLPELGIEPNVKLLKEISTDSSACYHKVEQKVPPIRLNLSQLSDAPLESINVISETPSSTNKTNLIQDETESLQQVPKLTIKLNKSSEDIKSPIPKLTIKHIRSPKENESSVKIDNNQQIPNVTKINIKAIPKPSEKNDTSMKHVEAEENKTESEHIPTVTKLNIKPIPKPPEKINDTHRKSSSSEISESECSENDESTSNSDQASASDNGTSNVIPKVTIKMGKPGTQSEGKFYTEQNVPKLTIKNLPHSEKEDQESVSKLKVVVNQSEDKQVEKIPKLTIKTVMKPESQPLSPKLTIKPIKPPDNFVKEPEIPKLKISTETLTSNADSKENVHVPKITIKTITKPDVDTRLKAAKKSVSADSPEHIPVVTKLNIKPIWKPTESGETSDVLEDKVPVVSKLNIKPVMKPKDNEVDSSVDVPKITKLNIKPLKNPEVNTSEQKDCDGMNADIDKNSIPVVTKLNIKPIVKPLDKERIKDSENQSSETGNSSDENADHIPVVTKLNIKPVLKPIELEEVSRMFMSNEPSIPVVTKLNIKPLVKPDDSISPSSPRKDSLKSPGSHSPTIPNITKLNIKPVVKPDEPELLKLKEEHEDKSIKKPSLVMKINMKTVTDSVINEICSTSEYSCNIIKDNVNMKAKSDTKSGNHSEVGSQRISSNKSEMLSTMDCIKLGSTRHSAQEHVIMQKCASDCLDESRSIESTSGSKKPDNLITTAPMGSPKLEDNRSRVSLDIKHGSPTSSNKTGQQDVTTAGEFQGSSNKGPEILRKSSRAGLQYCTLLKKLLENPKEEQGRKCNESKDSVKVDGMLTENLRSSPSLLTEIVKCELHLATEPDNRDIFDNTVISEKHNDPKKKSPTLDKGCEINIPSESNKVPLFIPNKSLQDFSKTANEDITKPLEISITDKNTNQSSDQDSPRIILKINKTDHGSSAKIVTEDVKKSETAQSDNTQQLVNDKPSPKKQLENCRKKGNAELSIQNLSVRTRLRSSRKVDSMEISPAVKQTTGKRPSSTEPSPPQKREKEMSVLDAKRLKLGQILSNNAMISPNVSISPVVGKVTQSLPMKPTLEIRQGGKLVNHSILNNDNCSKNGNSKLHNILSNLHAKQMRAMPFNDINCLEKTQSTSSEMDSNASTGSSEIVEITPIETRPIELQEMLINENSDFRDLSTGPEELSQDPLEPEAMKPVEEPPNGTETPRPVEMTPLPKKRGRPRKLPVTDSPKSAVVTLPVPALEERPQRSLRLTRERPVIIAKPRGGRGRGRGSRRGSTLQAQTPQQQPERVPSPPMASPSSPPASPTPIDPTSSRIKLPRMTEALDKMPSSSSTPLSSGTSDLNLFSDRAELKVVLEPAELDDSFMKSPESVGRPRGGRGSRGGRGRTPRGRGRGRGGGRGAMYMKETMGIYGRVCGPATTTVQLFEEETCMMDDNATPAKPSHLIDEDSQSSVKSSTNESSKMKKSKFADLFDSNKVWTAADVKEYTWPPTPRSDMESQVMMIQEQVAMFLGVKSFKRRYPELKRRTIVGEERDYVLGKGLVTEALCDLGITAVDASEVLDIMLSDYPHKYEEYRSHQRERRMTEVIEEPQVETKSEDKLIKAEVKIEKLVEHKPEPPKVDPEKTRQDMAAAAIASASEWNARANALRRPACVDLQSLTVHVRRSTLPRAQMHVRPPAGFYPHALLPGQYQHWYREYTPEQLRYFPMNTACSAPPPPLPVWECSSSSEGEAEGEESRAGDEDDSDTTAHPTHHNKRKKLTKMKRSSQTELNKEKEESRSSITEGEVDTCRVCKLRLEANRKYTHERFLVCANCNAKLHPSCVDLSADTIRKCREYAWQCAECKSCCACQRPADDDKMLFCDLCDRGFHIYCVGLETVPQGRWHCVECAICKSCGAREPSGLGGQGPPTGSEASPAPAEWHHQTKRGPGGHKCYSHSLCTPCARAYRIGRYCPLCERSFIGPKGTMQLVICKLCDRQLHQECVRQTVSSLNVLDYTCADCRRGGITSRAAAVRLAPRTIATLFMAKRRFNKYAHRQYLASRMAANAANDDATDATDTSADALHMDFGD